MENYQKYNWVDVEKAAKKIFCNDKNMILWAEDAWNLLMFERPIVEYCIASKKLSSFEEVDSFLWLVTLFDIYYDYQIKTNNEYGYSQYEQLTPEGYEVYNYTPKDYNCLFLEIENWYSKLSAFIQQYIYSHLLKKEFAFYEEQLTINNNRHIDNDIIDQFLNTILNKEIQERRSYFTNKILGIFESNSLEILLFMAGYHYVENYTQCKDKIIEIKESKKERLMSEPHLLESIIEEDIEEEISELVNDLPVSIRFLYDFFYEDYDIQNNIEVYDWINFGMPKLT